MGRHTPGTGGDPRSADTVSDPPIPHTKLVVGVDGTAVDVDATNPLPVTSSGGGGTQDVNVVSPDPLPVSLPADPLPVSLPSDPLPVSLPADPLPVSLPADPLPVDASGSTVPVSVTGQPVDVNVASPDPLPVSLPADPLPVSLPADPLPVDASGATVPVDIVSPDPLPVQMSGFVDDVPGLFRFADEVGDGSGNKDATGDYSAGGLGLTEFAIKPGAGEHFHITRLIVTIADSGSFDSGAYGNNVTLTNGILVQKRTGSPHGASSLVQDLTDSAPIMTNTGWAAYCYDVTVFSFGQGDEVLSARWTFTRAGVTIELDGDNGDYLAVVLNDDLEGLEGHAFQFQGLDAT